MQENYTLVLSSKDVNEIVETYGLDNVMDDLIARTHSEILSFDNDKIDIPIRSGFNYTGKNPGLIEWMPVHQRKSEVVIKVVGYHPNNPSHFGLPTILSSISAYDTQTGHLKGIADGVLLTALRTGAASALATKILAKPYSSVLGLIGCGAQSVTQLHAISRFFNLEKILIYDIDENAMHSFEQRVSVLNIDIEIIKSSINEIVALSDIISTATSIDVGAGPLFSTNNYKPHLHINAVGSDFPGKIELPKDFLLKSFVCPDFMAQAKIEGECQQLEDNQIGPDFSHLVKKDTDYSYAKNITSVFDSTGWALEDQIIMGLFIDLAHKFNIGKEILIENISKDAKNPYDFAIKTVTV